MSGSIVKSGSGVGPSGDPAPTAPVGLSQNTGNLLTTGSDNLLYLPPSAIQPTIWSARLRSVNLLHNANFEIDQRNAGQSIANNTGWAQDRWLLWKAGAMAATTQQTPYGASPPMVPGTNFIISTYYLRFTVGTAATLAATDVFAAYQTIEGVQLRELYGDVHSISILCRSSVAGLKFGIALQDSVSAYSLVKLCTIPTANTWTLITLPNIPVWSPSGNFPGAPGAIGAYWYITLAAGSSRTASANDVWVNANAVGAVGQSNLFATAGATFDVAFAQDEPGPLCTTLQDKPFAGANGNLEECLRYYCKSYLYTTKAGTVAAAGQIVNTALANGDPLFYVPFKKTMAKTPTVTGYNPITGAINSVRDYGATLDRAISATFAAGDSSFGGFNLSNWNAATSSYLFHYTADTGW